MIPVTIISRVDIPPITENVISDLIKAEILRANPELTINSIGFERKLNPQRIEAIVEAQVGASKPALTEAPAAVVQQVDFTPETKEEEPSVEGGVSEEKPKRKRVFT